MPKLPAVWTRKLPGPRGPETHALVVGASDYTNLPAVDAAGGPATMDLKKLRCAAISAWRIQQWLFNAQDELERPLTSIRTLLSPSKEEIDAEPDLPTGYPRPTFDEFVKAAHDWRKAADQNGDVTLLYFAGHGLQRESTKALLVMDDFGSGMGDAFAKTVRLQNIIDGMAPSEETPTIAQTQYYFIDACRNEPKAMKKFKAVDGGQVFNDLNERDDRALAIFNATTKGRQAEGLSGRMTNYCEALLGALAVSSDRSEGTGPAKRWIVTADMLKKGIVNELKRAGRAINAPLTQSGSEDMVLMRMTKPPEVELAITVAPEACIPTAQIEIRDGRFKVVQTFPKNGVQHPYAPRVPMGVYVINATAPAGFKSYEGEAVEITFRRNRDWALDLT